MCDVAGHALREAERVWGAALGERGALGRLSGGLKETWAELGTLGEAFPGKGNSKCSGPEQEWWLLQGSMLDPGWGHEGWGGTWDPGEKSLVLFCV